MDPTATPTSAQSAGTPSIHHAGTTATLGANNASNGDRPPCSGSANRKDQHARRTKAYRMGFQAAIDTLQDVAEFLVDKTKMANVINGALDMAALVEDKYYLRDKINNRQERA